MTDEERKRARKAFNTLQRRKARQQLVNDYRGERCFDCGGTFDSVCLDLEHLDPSRKVASIAWMVRNATLAALEAELKKTIPLCACCHRMRTAYGPPGRS